MKCRYSLSSVVQEANCTCRSRILTGEFGGSTLTGVPSDMHIITLVWEDYKFAQVTE
jgi:hypothetical protein